MREMIEFDYGVVPSQKGDPIYDIRGLEYYCKEHNIDTSNGAPEKLAEMFIIGYR